MLLNRISSLLSTPLSVSNYAYQLIVYEMLMHLIRQVPTLDQSVEQIEEFAFYQNYANQLYRLLKQPKITDSICAHQNEIDVFQLKWSHRLREYESIEKQLPIQIDLLKQQVFYLEGRELDEITVKIKRLSLLYDYIKQSIKNAKLRPDKLMPELSELPSMCGRQSLIEPLLVFVKSDVASQSPIVLNPDDSLVNTRYLEIVFSIVLLSKQAHLTNSELVSIETLLQLMEEFPVKNTFYSIDTLNGNSFIEVCYEGVGRLGLEDRINLITHVMASLLNLLNHPLNHFCLYSRKNQFLAKPMQSTIAIQFGLFQMPWQEIAVPKPVDNRFVPAKI